MVEYIILKKPILEELKVFNMALDLILEDWSDYDNNKIIGKVDSSKFSCEEKWEVDYLKKKILMSFPDVEIEAIDAAIKLCCLAIKAPRPRKTFVSCVLKRLELYKV